MKDTIARLRTGFLLASGIVGGSACTKVTATTQPTTMNAMDASVPGITSVQPALLPDAVTVTRRVIYGDYRPIAATCSTAIAAGACHGTESYLGCRSDSDCTAHPHGRCTSGRTWPGGGSYCDCMYACANDSECGAREVCMCAGTADLTISTCVPADCRTDSDCASGVCGISSYWDGCHQVVSLGCRNSTDTCFTNGDCINRDPLSKYRVGCAYSSGSWSCTTGHCMIGRPFYPRGQVQWARHRSNVSGWLLNQA